MIVELVPLCALLESGGCSNDPLSLSLSLEVANVELIPLCPLLENGGRSDELLSIFAHLLWKRRSLS
ncbi:hypothetical protein V6N13_019642 [Hibiscus sabdariffa]|uniref:Secreted protein n=1 Tax=Hibiscus sabdariffa TaxID=183260 RepID=A0ABR2EK27_9ROSI